MWGAGVRAPGWAGLACWHDGPMEQAFIGAPIEDMHDPVELGHVARSFDSCLVCTVHAYDGKTGEELSKFQVNNMC